LKSLFDKPAGALALLLATGCWATTAPAGVSALAAASADHEAIKPAGERQRPSGDRELPTTREASQRNQADSVIKCWQYGRLILDEPDWKGHASSLPGPVLESDNGRYARMKLMPFGNTFCTLKQGGR
jgi:hypothetical protein